MNTDSLMQQKTFYSVCIHCYRMDGSMEKNVRRFYLYRFFTAMNFTSAITIPFLTDWGGISFFQVMLLQSWFLFWVFVFEVPSGSLADYVGRKITLLIAVCVLFIAVIFFSTVPSIWFFLIAEFLWGVAISLISGADNAFVYDSLRAMGKETDSKHVFSRTASFQVLATIIATPIGAFIAQFDLRLPMMCRLIPYAFAIGIAITFKEPQKGELNNHCMDIMTTNSYINILKEGFQIFRENKILHYLAFDMIGIAMVYYGFYWIFQLALAQVGVSIRFWGVINTAGILLSIIFLNTMKYWEKVFPSKILVLSISGGILGVSAMMCGLFLNTAWICIVSIILGMGFGPVRNPLLNSYINKFIESEQRATVLSFISMFERLFFMIFNIGVGYIAERNLNLLYLGLAGLTFFVLVFSRVQESHLQD